MIPTEWLTLFEAAKRVCDERLLIHKGPNPAVPTEHDPDCAACLLRKALNDVGVDTKKGAS